jgi:uncharacterized protein YciI
MADPDVHYLLAYDYVPDMAERRGPYRPAHLTHIRAELEAGTIVMAGALGDPPTGGAFVFRGVDRNHIEAFVAGDPYASAGLVTSWRAERWNLV